MADPGFLRPKEVPQVHRVHPTEGTAGARHGGRHLVGDDEIPYDDLVNLEELKRNYYLFDPRDYGRIFVFVDFSNVRHWAKSFWPGDNRQYFRREIDIQRLAEIADLVRPARRFFYYGHYQRHPSLPDDHPSNVRYRQSIFRIDKARKAGFSVRTKAIKEIETYDDDGQFVGKISKCNFDIEMAMDMLLKIDKYDTAFLWSGDSDFHFLLEYMQSKKKRVVTICSRDFASDELRRHSTLFIPADPLKELLEYVPDNKTPPAGRGAERRS